MHHANRQNSQELFHFTVYSHNTSIRPDHPGPMLTVQVEITRDPTKE